MPINSRRKGAVGERELAAELNSLGMLAHRSVQFSATAGDADVTVRGLKAHVEVKRVRRARLTDYVAQAKRDARNKPWVIALRQDGCEWLMIQPLAQWCADSAMAQEAIAARKALMEAADETAPVPPPAVP